MKTVVAAAMKWTACNLLLLLSLAPSLNATDMSKQFASRVRFLENVDTWGGKDALDRERFLEAFYWASLEFDPGSRHTFSIVIIHCDKDMGAFMKAGPYPAAVYSPREQDLPVPYEIWLFGRVNDEVMMNTLTNIFEHALKLESKKATSIGQRAYIHLKSTINVKELERK